MNFETGFKNVREHKKGTESEDKLFYEIIQKIEELSQKGEKIGFGMTAEVFTSKTEPSVCYKIIVKEHPIFRNNVHKEADILTKASKLSGDVIVPEPYYSIETENGQFLEVLVMKRLDAVSIRDLIENGLSLTENFNLETFFKKIKAYFERLHDKNIFHRDLHWGNIMIENETGNPCVIDFGMSTEEFSSMENPYKIIKSNGAEHFITDDMIRINEVRNELRKYIFQKKNVSH